MKVNASLMEPPNELNITAAALEKAADWSRDLLGRGKEVEDNALKACMEAAESPCPNWNCPLQQEILDAAYERCGEVTGEYAKTFYLGTKLMTPAKQRAIWAIYVWCRRTDELVDGPNASRVTPKALERWDERLQAVFAGEPYDVLDAALSHTLSEFPMSIQPFRDMVDGMRMDLVKSRYNNFDELYEYCYRVAGTVALMTVPVMGIDENFKGDKEKVYHAALSLGLANQLTNILRDVGEDVTRGRIYLPLDDLNRFGITEEEVVKGLYDPTTGQVDNRWKEFMKFQIARAREIFKESEKGINALHVDARWPVWSALVVYREILDAIEANDYDNFTKRAYVPKWRKTALLPYAYVQGLKGLDESLL